MIDETTDSMNRIVFNVLVGALNNMPSKPMLISTQFLKDKTSETIYKDMKRL